MFHGIVRHLGLQLGVGGAHLPRQQIVNVGALHAQGSELLLSLVKAAPSLFGEGDAHVGQAEVSRDRIEVNLLDHLQTELFVAFLALLLHVPLHYVCYHELESHRLTSPVDPCLGHTIDVYLYKALWHMPVFVR